METVAEGDGGYPYDAVKIVWQDAETDDGGWQVHSELAPKKHLCITYGFLLQKTKDFCLIASTIGISAGEPENCSRFQIPRGMVQSITVVEKRAMKRKRKTAPKVAEQAPNANP